MTLHLASPPVDKLLLPPSQEACKQAFMGQLKEVDFLRWGNTKRVTGLRKAEQDGIWDGIKDRKFGCCFFRNNPFPLIHMSSFFLTLHIYIIDNFDNFWRVASKVCPTPNPPQNLTSPPQQQQPASSTLSRSPVVSDQPGGGLPDSSYTVRNLPIRIYLPDGPVLQDLVSPTVEGGKRVPSRAFYTHVLTFFNRSTPDPAEFFDNGFTVTFPGRWTGIGVCLDTRDRVPSRCRSGVVERVSSWSRWVA